MKKHALLLITSMIIAAHSVFADAAVCELKNDKVVVAFDAKGNLLSLKNLAANREYAGGQGLWRMIYSKDELLEESVESESVSVKVEKVSDSEIKLSYAGEFPVEVSCVLDGDDVKFKAKVSNASDGKLLREFQFPMIKNAQLPVDPILIHSAGGGGQIRGFFNHVKGAHTLYKSQDNKAVERYAEYPINRAMNMYVLQEPDCSLYFGNCDPNFEATLHLFRYRKVDDKFKYLDLAMVKYPFIKSGENYETSVFTISPHMGDWHVSARKYRAGATWYQPPQQPPSVRDMNGWQRMILRHQYGTVLFPYSDLPKICKAGMEAGIDTMLMFGWWKEGMDAGYPDYTPEDKQGGDDALRQDIKKFQAAGGKVITYFNGQLIDVSTKFYKERGEKLSVKTSSGLPHIERYPFGGDGTGLRVLGHKTFVTGCHSTKEWRDVLKSYIDRSFSLGADGVFFDQLGLGSQICWDPSHGHKVPCINMMKYKADTLREMRAYIKAKNPNFSFGTEHAGDATAQYVDFVHSCGMDYNIGGKEGNGKPYLKSVPLFRYAFPETKVSDRTIRDDTDIARRVNVCLMWGLISDVEIYRCRATIDAAPTYKAYLTKADELRDKYRALILNGTFRDTDIAKSSSDKVDYTVFTNGGELGVFVTNSFLKSDKTKISVAGYDFVKADGIGQYKVSGSGDSAEVELEQNALALLIFRRK